MSNESAQVIFIIWYDTMASIMTEFSTLVLMLVLFFVSLSLLQSMGYSNNSDYLIGVSVTPEQGSVY